MDSGCSVGSSKALQFRGRLFQQGAGGVGTRKPAGRMDGWRWRAWMTGESLD